MGSSYLSFSLFRALRNKRVGGRLPDPELRKTFISGKTGVEHDSLQSFRALSVLRLMTPLTEYVCEVVPGSGRGVGRPGWWEGSKRLCSRKEDPVRGSTYTPDRSVLGD